MFSILHISDLHRSRIEPIDNASLIAALMSDRDRFVLEAPPVPRPEAIVVSGDLIQGVRIGETGWRDEIKSQYDVAYEFLAALTDRVVGGDRSQVVLLPGNHDVCWNTALSAMSQVLRSEEPAKILDEMGRSQSPYRWSWRDRQFFKVVDAPGYAARLDSFWAMVERFYNGVALPMPLDRGRGFNLFELNGGAIALAAFSSLSENDCFSLQGSFHTGAVANAALSLRDWKRPHRLKMAAWHHSVQGPPARSDYLDVAAIYNMIGFGFRLGLHGHQHMAETSARNIHLPDELSMALVSAGSLCAGASDLPRGVNRQYNVVVVEDDYQSCRVHVRQVGEGEHYAAKQDGQFAGRGFVPVRWRPPEDLAGRPIDEIERSVRTRVEAAEREVRGGRPTEAISILTSLPPIPKDRGSLARGLLIEALEQSEDWEDLLSAIGPPANAEDLVRSVTALEKLRRYEDAQALLRNTKDVELPPFVVSDIQGRLSALISARSKS